MDATDFKTEQTCTLFDLAPSPSRPSPGGTALQSRDSKRQRHHTDLTAIRERSETSASGLIESPVDRAKALVRRELLFFVRSRGVGERIQSSDFVNWFESQESGEHAAYCKGAGLDLRCVGPMFKALTACNVLRVVDHAANGGSVSPTRETRSNSSVRPVYEIALLNFAKVPWGEFDGRKKRATERRSDEATKGGRA